MDDFRCALRQREVGKIWLASKVFASGKFYSHPHRRERTACRKTRLYRRQVKRRGESERGIICAITYTRGGIAMLPKLAAACTVVALSVSPCFGQSWGRSDGKRIGTVFPTPCVAPGRPTPGDSWKWSPQTIPGAPPLLESKGGRHRTIQCFQRLIEKHFLRQVTADSTQLRSWCLDDVNPRHCLESLAAQEVEQWRYNRTMAAPLAQADPNRIVSR